MSLVVTFLRWSGLAALRVRYLEYCRQSFFSIQKGHSIDIQNCATHLIHWRSEKVSAVRLRPWHKGQTANGKDGATRPSIHANRFALAYPCGKNQQIKKAPARAWEAFRRGSA